MKVGVYFPCLPPEIGGGYTFEKEMLDALLQVASESQHHFILFFGVQGRQIPSKKVDFDDKVEIVYIPLPGTKFLRGINRLFTEIRRIMGRSQANLAFQREIDKRDIDLIWFPTPDCLLVDSPFIATVWDIQHRAQPWFPEVSYRGAWEVREAFFGKVLRQAVSIIVANEIGKEEISRYYQVSPERIFALPHPTPYIEQIPSREEAKSFLTKYHIGPHYLFYPAQFWPHKNHVNLLLALKHLRTTCKLDLELVLTGGDQGNQKFIKTRIKQLDLEDKVHILGFVSRQELIAFYRCAFALSYVTYFGPENLPPLEAFVCGCPVVASNIPGAKLQYGDAALLVDPNDPEEISKTIKFLYDNPDIRLDMITKGYHRAKQFTSMDYIRQIINLIDRFACVRRNWNKWDK